MAASIFVPAVVYAPTDATYVTQTANASLSAEQALSALSTGVMQVTTTTGAITSVTTSAGLAALLSDETGSGSLVFANTPTLVTPVLGAATGTSINLSGNIRGASFNVGATAGVDASIVIPAVATITVSKGIITAVA